MWSVFFLQIGQQIKSCIKWHSQQWPNATFTMLAALLYICHQIASATRLSMKRMININTKSCCCAQIVWTKSNETKASRVSQAQIPRDSPSESQASTFFVFPHFSSTSWHSIFFAQTSTYHIYFWIPIPSLACRFTFSCTQTQLHPSLVAATAQPTRGWTLARRLRLIMFAN